MEPIFFRPSELDAAVIELIQKAHPVSGATSAAALRIAIEAYWHEHGPDAKNSRGARLNRLESKVDEIIKFLQMGGNDYDHA